MSYNLPKFAIASLSLLLTISAATAQTTDCEKLKAEVVKLRAENALLRKGSASSPQSQLADKQTVQKIEYNLVKCEGNAKAQTVTVILLLNNTGANRDLQFEQLRAIDDQGEEYKTYNINIGSGSLRNKLATAIPIRTVATIPKVLPTTKKFNLIACPVYDDEQPGRTINIEFRDVAITWK